MSNHAFSSKVYNRQKFVIPKNSVYQIQFNGNNPNYYRVNNMGETVLYFATMNTPREDLYDFKCSPNSVANFAEPYTRDFLYCYNPNNVDVDILLTYWEGEFDPSFIAFGESTLSVEGVVKTDGIINAFNAPLPAGSNKIGAVDVVNTDSNSVPVRVLEGTEKLNDIYNVLYTIAQNGGSGDIITVHDAPKKLIAANQVYLLGINVATLKPLTMFDINSIMYDENGNKNNNVTLKWNIGTTTHSVSLDKNNVSTFFSVGNAFIFNADNVWIDISNACNFTFKYETTQKKIPEVSYINITTINNVPPSTYGYVSSQASILSAIQEKGYNSIYNIVEINAPSNIKCYKSINEELDISWENALCNDVMLGSDNAVDNVTVQIKVAVYNS